ncbi:MAG: hypothetical protein ACOCXX_05165, partial [Planctomycetota bacterium]
MKTHIIAVSCLFILLASISATLAADCVLVRDGQPAATIVVADAPDEIPLSLRPHRDNNIKERVQLTARYAAEQLQHYIKKATGATLPIVAASKAPANGTLVLVGRSRLVADNKLPLPETPEGIRLVHFPRGIAVLGEVHTTGQGDARRTIDRSVHLAAYRLLDELGFRFYFYDDPSDDLGEVIPKTDTVKVTEAMAFDTAPDFPFRSGFLVGSFAHNDLVVRVNRTGNTTGFYANHTD